MINRAAAVCLLLVSSGASAATVDNYAYAWPLQTNGDSAAWQVELNADVYAAIHSDDLRDVEIVNAAGASVPMAPSAAQFSAATTNDVELPLFDFPGRPDGAGSNDDRLHLAIERDVNGRLRQLNVDDNANRRDAAQTTGQLMLDARALKDAAIDSLWLAWDANGNATTAQYSVSGSDDLQQWHVLNGSASVLNMQQNGNSLSRRQITLNGARAKYLRLQRLDNAAALPNLHVKARTLAASSLIQAARVWVDAQAQTAPATEQRATPGIYYQLPAPLAVEALKLEMATDNSLARLHVLSRVRPGDDANAWQSRAEFTAFRLRQDDNVIGNDEIPIATGGRSQDWRIDPATPLDHAPTLRVAFRPDRFVFLAQGSGPYRLVAGSVRARRGDYPVDAALAQLRGKFGADWQPPLAILGTRAALQSTAAYAPPPVQRDYKTWLLWAVLVGAAALIGGMALSLLRKK
jgi:hypothetical protein